MNIWKTTLLLVLLFTGITVHAQKVKISLNSDGNLTICGLAPTLTVNDEVHPKMTPEKAIDLLNELRGETV